MEHLTLRRGSMVGLFLTLASCIAGCSSNLVTAAPPELTSLTTLATPAVQNAQGLLVVDATAFQANLPKGRHSWQLQKDLGAKDGTSMAALRDLNMALETRALSQSPRLDYRVTFTKAGTHYVWVRGQAAAGAGLDGDSLHVGLNRRIVSSSSRITGFTQNYGWVNKTMSRRVATLKIAKPGTYTLNVWMREDGTQFDVLALTTDARFRPTDALLAAAPMPTPAAPIPSSPVPAPTPVSPSPITAVAAKAADAFVDSVGVNTHLHFDDTVYNRFDDLIKPKLLALGVRHIRDGAYTYAAADRNSFYYTRLRELGARGIRLNLLTNIRTNYSAETDFSLLDDIYLWTDGAVETFEGANEPDIQSGTSDWVGQTRAAQKALYNTVKGNAALRKVKVIGPSPVAKASALGDLSSEMDYGNSHSYTGGAMPMVSGYGSLKFNLDKAALNSRADPVIVTEVGYHSALKTQNGHKPVSEEAAAVYTPRLLLSYFDKGVARTYLYQLIDHISDASLTDPEAAFGLLRQNGEEKPVYRAVKTLLGLLKDPGSSFTPGSLRYELQGNTQNVQQILLQKRDGTFYLALWVEAPSWDQNAKRELRVGEQPLTLELGDPVTRATRYAFQNDGRAVSERMALQEGRLELKLDDKLTLLELTPSR